MTKNPTTNNSFWRIFAIVSLIAFCVIGYLVANSNRYRPMYQAALILDSWTGKVYDIDGHLFKLPN